MKIQLLSDMHLELCSFNENLATDAQVICLLGDIHKGTKGLDWARGAFPHKEIIYVAGNHEFYGRQRHEVLNELRLFARQLNIHFLENDFVILENKDSGELVRFIGCTLWSDFSLFAKGIDRKEDYKTELDCMVAAQNYVTDFRVIHEGKHGHFGPGNAKVLCLESLTYLKNTLRNKPAAVRTDVIVTHHMPSMRSVPDRFKTSLLSAAFASEVLEDFKGDASLWCHGHGHNSVDYTLDGCRVVANPRGYETYSGRENGEFNPRLVIDI